MARSIIQADKEIWRDIRGYEGLYKVSNFGRVKGLYFINNKFKHPKEHFLKPCVKDNKYLYVSLRKNGQRKNKYIHRLVAEAFLSKVEGKNIVNHINYDVTNNKAENLEWCTQKENVNYSCEHMKHQKNAKLPKGTNEKYIHLMPNGKYRVCLRWLKVDKQFNSLDEAIKKRDELLITQKGA